MSLICQKDKYSIDPDITYLNGSYMSPQLKSVESAGIEAIQRKSKPWRIKPIDFFSEAELLRKLFAQLINTPDHNRIALIPSVSYGIANAARNIRFEKGQEILILDKIFPSNYYIWKHLTSQYDLKLSVISPPDTLHERGQKWNEKIIQAITNNTKVIVLEHCHWTDGTLFDLQAIRQKANEVGALIVVDGTQSIGAFPFDQSIYDVDVLVTACYKSMMGPYSMGLAYYGNAFDQGDPLEHNWMNKVDSDNFEKLLNYTEENKSAAARYNMGEQSQFVNVPMAIQAITQLLEWGVPNVQSYCQSIIDEMMPLLKAKNIWIENEKYRANHLFGLVPNHAIDSSFKQKLLDNNVFVSFRGSSIRVALNVYNDSKDLLKLISLI